MKYKEYDVIVCGAGISGISASISSSRLGAKTLLLEEDSVLGGACVDYGVQSFCGEPIEGIHKEIRKELYKVDPYYKETGHCFFWSNFVNVVNKMLKDAKVDFIPNVKVIGGICKGDRVMGIKVLYSDFKRIETKIFLSKVVIDATGNGDVALSVGCKFRFGRESRKEFNEEFAPLRSDKKVQKLTWMYICEKFKDTNYKPSWCYMGENKYLMWGGGFYCKDPTNPEELKKTQDLAWNSLMKQFNNLRRKGFKIVYVAPKIGIRETRRIEGEYILRESDLKNPKGFYDAICTAKYPIDLWEDLNKDLKWPDDFEVPFYQIPYRCLIPKGKEGLLVVGRCISGTHVAMGSYRVMAIVSLIGEAGGVAAFLSAKEGKPLREINIKEMQKILKRRNITIS